MFITTSPDWKTYPDNIVRSVPPPRKWQGLDVEWNEGYAAAPVFIGQGDRQEMCPDFYLFGLRFETSKAAVHGRPLSAGHFIQYLVFEGKDDALLVHRLSQNRGPVYCGSGNKGESVRASDVLIASNGGGRYLNAQPEWNVDDAQWPSLDGNPMMFISQFDLIGNDVTREWLTWDKTVFLFHAVSKEGGIFRITTQDRNCESASEHHVTE